MTHIFQHLTKKTLGLTFALSAAAFAFAQEKTNVTGQILDNQQLPVPYASVSFNHKTNKLFSDAVLTDDKGNYKIQLVPGNYEITIEAIDFKKNTISKQISAGKTENFTLNKEETTTNNRTQDIQGVTIVAAAKNPYRVELDKKVYDVSQDLTAKGGNLQDVLANVPSVNVDADGSVSMRGNANIRFLINGKPSSILGITDDANALKNIPADQIEKIEVITNPSSKYEASGTAGILNIILKKSKGLGFNGSVEGSVGYLPQSRLNTNLSWNLEKLSWFVNGGGGFGRFENKTKTYTDYYERTITVKEKDSNGNEILVDKHYERDVQNIESKNKNDFKNGNVNAGINYNFTDKTSANASININGGNNEGITNEFKNSSLTHNSLRTTASIGENNNLQLDAGLEHKFNDKGQIINLTGSYQNSKNNSNSNIDDFEGGLRKYNQINDNSQKTYLAKLDYELPIGENSKLEAGARYDDRTSITDNKYAETTNNLYTLFENGTSTIDYLEKISAFYTQFKSKINKFSYQLGVRNENTDININYSDLVNTDQKTKKSYSGFFPTAFFGYELSENSQVSLNYSKRINRPRGFQLIPTVRIQNKASRFQGNADLNPSYVNSFELGYNYSKGSKFTLNPTLYYQRTNDDVSMTVREMIDADTQERYNLTTPANIGTEDRYGMDFNYNFTATKWLRLFGNINLFGYKNESEYDNIKTSNSGFASQARLTAGIKLDKTTNMQLSGNYNGPQKTFQNERLAMYAANFGFSKSLMNNQATLNFNVQDIFNTRRRRAITNNETFYREMDMQMMPRTITLSFSYRFKNKFAEEKKTKPKRQDQQRENGGMDDGPM